MNFNMPQLNSGENNKSLERMREFDSIKTPEELYFFMKENVKYGFVGKNDKKIYSPEHEGWHVGVQPEIGLQDPEAVLESGYGTCWEQTELERKWFAEKKYEFKTFLLMFGDAISQKNPAHTMLAYKKDEKWFWFENTLDGSNGYHEFENLENLIEAVKTKLIDSAVDSGATEEDIDSFRLYEYNTPAYNCSMDEFISKVVSENQIKNNLT